MFYLAKCFYMDGSVYDFGFGIPDDTFQAALDAVCQEIKDSVHYAETANKPDCVIDKIVFYDPTDGEEYTITRETVMGSDDLLIGAK